MINQAYFCDCVASSNLDRSNISSQVPAHVEELFHSSHCDKVPWYDGTFWVLVASLREFVKRNPSHQLPLSGVLPDIKSDTQQALEDFETFKDIMYDVRDSLDELPSDDDTDYHTELGHGHEPPDTSISPEMLESFVKNSAHMYTFDPGRRTFR
ncbi:hypothetical protein MJO29_016228 [Puccinia striiformis f. sp. tritici]|uniref:hypothetical protein n=1 Tax=Puccinia striiformis f. sp. tritici TaxID=168172 RepID=UPI0020079BF2|nr:hypothetical protein Pst134EA_030475 [Puccinia striiformis f. sp. tritici]KAH9440395.1 hypothetical protein Pst134EB_031011 [Puccinia striiformis f. sp. tritici]KAH9446562.1 hypothetical protein Pst134EA_030475 [Puccinia striiformis f. sp. tritici]KAI7934965.1 hypothetical protein MJO29_016228 [Puccinia striiformis f. sp. tritici]